MKNVYTQTKGTLIVERIGNTDYKVLYAQIPLSELSLQEVSKERLTGNPRLWNLEKSLRERGLLTGKFTQSKIILAMSDSEWSSDLAKHTALLKEAIAVGGRLNEPIIVDCNGVVIEGHRRFVACTLLSAEGNHNFDKVDVKIYPSNIAAKDVDLHLNSMHVCGKLRWESADKSAMTAKLRDEYGLSADEIAKRFGWRLKSVTSYLKTYDLLTEYQSETKDFDPDQFTKFWKMANNVKFMDAMFDEQDPDYNPDLWPTMKTFIKEGKINDCRDIALFTSKDVGFLSSPRAMNIIAKQGTTAAKKFMVRNGNGEESLLHLCERLSASISGLGNQEKRELAMDSVNSKKIRAALQQAEADIAELLLHTSTDKAA